MPLDHQMRQAPSSETMQGPTGVRGRDLPEGAVRIACLIVAVILVILLVLIQKRIHFLLLPAYLK